MYDTLAVNLKGGNMVAGSCSTLADNDGKPEVEQRELEIVGFPERLAKSARRSKFHGVACYLFGSPAAWKLCVCV